MLFHQHEYEPDILIAWTFAYDYLFEGGQALIQKTNDVYICSKKEHKRLIIAKYILGKYHLMKCNFDDFVMHFKVHLIKLNTENCNCSWFLKNYYCYHLVAIAANEKLVEIPLGYKNVSIAPKNKRGGKAKAKPALERN